MEPLKLLLASAEIVDLGPTFCRGRRTDSEFDGVSMREGDGGVVA